MADMSIDVVKALGDKLAGSKAKADSSMAAKKVAKTTMVQAEHAYEQAVQQAKNDSTQVGLDNAALKAAADAFSVVHDPEDDPPEPAVS